MCLYKAADTYKGIITNDKKKTNTRAWRMNSNGQTSVFSILCWCELKKKKKSHSIVSVQILLHFPMISLSKQMQLLLGSRRCVPRDGLSPWLLTISITNPVLEGVSVNRDKALAWYPRLVS